MHTTQPCGASQCEKQRYRKSRAKPQRTPQFRNGGKERTQRIRERGLEGKRTNRNIQSNAGETRRKVCNENSVQWRSEEREGQKEDFGADVWKIIGMVATAEITRS